MNLNPIGPWNWVKRVYNQDFQVPKACLISGQSGIRLQPYLSKCNDGTLLNKREYKPSWCLSKSVDPVAIVLGGALMSHPHFGSVNSQTNGKGAVNTSLTSSFQILSAASWLIHGHTHGLSIMWGPPGTCPDSISHLHLNQNPDVCIHHEIEWPINWWIHAYMCGPTILCWVLYPSHVWHMFA